MRELILEYIDLVWEIGHEEEFLQTQLDIHLMSDDDLFKFFVDFIKKEALDENRRPNTYL
jgi:hypothetical protein